MSSGNTAVVPMSDLEVREKLARFVSFLTRYLRIELDERKRTSSNYITYHRLSQNLDAVEKHACMTYRFVSSLKSFILIASYCGRMYFNFNCVNQHISLASIEVYNSLEN